MHVKFSAEHQVNVIIRLASFSLEMQTLIRRFSYKHAGIKSFTLYVNKLKFEAPVNSSVHVENFYGDSQNIIEISALK